jgi:hypothetical protein
LTQGVRFIARISVIVLVSPAMAGAADHLPDDTDAEHVARRHHPYLEH